MTGLKENTLLVIALLITAGIAARCIIDTNRLAITAAGMSNISDTIMNIEIFAFIGILVWLYLKPVSIERPGADSKNTEESRTDSLVASCGGRYRKTFLAAPASPHLCPNLRSDV